MRVVATSSLPIELAGQLAAALPDVQVDVPSGGHAGLVNVDLTDADALICLLLDKIDRDVLARAPKLRVIANCAVGIDNIDVAAATAANVVVTNTPNVLTEATAEFAFTLMLAAARRLGEGERLVRSGTWSGWALDQLLGVELHGKTLGIVGHGRIGRAMARRALAFGMRVVVTGSSAPPDPPAVPLDVDELFATADVVSLHCPLTPATRNLVDARRLGLMKPTSILVNTARGGCVDEAALAAALAAGQIAGAGLDVYAHEPRISPALVACERVVLAPHIGSATTETRTAMAQLCADAVIAVLGNPARRPPNQVNA
ncbi:MAG: D-glycerate dehydrogenase, partial [Deltaproteobacteria bacterium]|nr:D-glycerate dehydrogenase [Deltaproteobacteria bacterium]